MALLGEGGTAARLFARVRRPLGRLFLRRKGGLANLERLGDRLAGRQKSSPLNGASVTGSGGRILIASLRAWPAHNAYEALFAHGLRLRGAEVSLLTCGGGQPLCELGWARRVWPLPCDRCGWYTDRVAEAARLPHYRIADGLPWGANARRAPLEVPAAPAGIDARRASEISLAWMVKSTDDEGSPGGEGAMARDFAVSAAAVARSAERHIEDFRPDTVVLVNGLFAAEDVIREVALARGIRVITYELGVRENSLVFSADAPAPLYEMDATWKEARDRPLQPAECTAIERMLSARAEGRAAHERYFDDQLADSERVRAALDIPAGARVISMFTNLAWDSAVVGRDLAYPSMLEWIEHAVALVGELEDAVLVIRVHPAEERWGTMQPVDASLPELPPSVRLIGPDQPLSSYTLLDMSDLALTYATTMGLEAAAHGVPVAVAADTHYRGRGFTHDLSSPADLESLLRAGAWAISSEQAQLALRYAYMFFFKCHVPFPAVPVEGGFPQRVPADPSELLPGADPYLDFICDRILDGGEFVLPDELALRYVARTGRG